MAVVYDFSGLNYTEKPLKVYENSAWHNYSGDPYLTNLSDFYNYRNLLPSRSKNDNTLNYKNSSNSFGIFLIRFMLLFLLCPFSPFKNKTMLIPCRKYLRHSSGNKGCLKNNSWHSSSRQIFYGCFKLKTPMNIHFPPTNCQMEIIILESGAIWRP